MGIGNYLTAKERVWEAYLVAKSNGNKKRLAGTLATLGRISRILGDNGQATTYLESSLKYAEELEDRGYQADALLELGVIYRMTGMYAQAFDASFRALDIFEKSEKSDDKLQLEAVRKNIATLYAEQGDYQKMEEQLSQSWQLAKQLDDKPGMVGILQILGIANREQGHIDKALVNLKESLALAEETKLPGLIVYSQLPLGSIYQLKGDYEKASDLYNRSLVTAQEIGDKHLVAGTLLQMGDWYLSKGDYSKAVEFAGRAGAVADEVTLPEISYLAKTIKGKAQFAIKQFDLAQKSLLDSISIIEQLRSQVSGGEQDLERFFQNRISPYQAMVSLLIEQRNTTEALAYAERAKARVLLDVLRNGRININKTMSQKEQLEERRLYNELVSLNTQVQVEKARQQPDDTRIRELESRLQEARNAYEAFQVVLYAAHPELKIKRGLLPSFTIEDAAALIPDTGNALMEYVVTDKQIFLFVLTRDSTRQARVRVKVYPIDINRSDLSNLVENFQKLLGANHPGFRQAGRQLYDLLVKPAETELQRKTTLCIVPDGPLWNLPFQALQTNTDKYLLELYAMYYAPSLQILREMRKKATGMRNSPVSEKDRSASLLSAQLFAIGNPSTGSEAIAQAHTLRDAPFISLPETEREVQAIGTEVYGPQSSSIRIGLAAREGAVKAEMGKYRVLHFATHGVLDNRNPLYSYLVLAPGKDSGEDGFLEAWELMEMNLKAEMVVLSACNTARGKVGAGEGMIGMTWALFVAGVPTVVASQWEVPSQTTTSLMVAFHRNARKSLQG